MFLYRYRCVCPFTGDGHIACDGALCRTPAAEAVVTIHIAVPVCRLHSSVRGLYRFIRIIVVVDSAIGRQGVYIGDCLVRGAPVVSHMENLVYRCPLCHIGCISGHCVADSRIPPCKFVCIGVICCSGRIVDGRRRISFVQAAKCRLRTGGRSAIQIIDNLIFPFIINTDHIFRTVGGDQLSRCLHAVKLIGDISCGLLARCGVRNPLSLRAISIDRLIGIQYIIIIIFHRIRCTVGHIFPIENDTFLQVSEIFCSGSLRASLILIPAIERISHIVDGLGRILGRCRHIITLLVYLGPSGHTVKSADCRLFHLEIHGNLACGLKHRIPVHMVYICTIRYDCTIPIVCAILHDKICPVYGIGTDRGIRRCIIRIRYSIYSDIRHRARIGSNHIPVIISCSVQTRCGLWPRDASGACIIPGIPITGTRRSSRFPDIEICSLPGHISGGVSRYSNDRRRHPGAGRSGDCRTSFLHACHFSVPVNRSNIGVTAGPCNRCIARFNSCSQLYRAIGCN